MKKEAFFIALLFSFFGGYAQNYVPFPETDVEWVSHIYHEEQQWMKPGSYCYDSHIETDGDTIINSLKYIKLKEVRVNYITPWYACLTQIDTITSAFFGWMRNDTINKKVYFRKWNWNKDTLFYDFNVGIGDTLDDTYILNNDQLNLYTIDTIKNYTIGGVNRKVYFIDDGNYVLRDSIIEGIGSSNGTFSLLEDLNYTEFTFLCMNLSGTKIYPPGGTCPAITTIDEEILNKVEVRVYPNPVKTNFWIEYPTYMKMGSITLYDCIGRIAKEFVKKNGKYDVQDISPGIYFLRVKIENQYYTKKLIINNP